MGSGVLTLLTSGPTDSNIVLEVDGIDYNVLFGVNGT